MDVQVYEIRGIKIAEVTAEEVLVRTESDAVQLMMDITYSAQGCEKIILHQKNLAAEFFDLKSRLAGEVLQKFVNYKLQVAIVGNFQDVKSEALKAFIAESNRGRQNYFANGLESAKTFLLKTGSLRS